MSILGRTLKQFFEFVKNLRNEFLPRRLREIALADEPLPDSEASRWFAGTLCSFQRIRISSIQLAEKPIFPTPVSEA
jgi:hypothetical protein